LPGRGCSRQCVYCDQLAITRDGGGGGVTPEVVRNAAVRAPGPVEICFFGGSFARLPRGEMREYLDCVRSAPSGSAVTFSSYPGDFSGARGADVIGLLGEYPMATIELGVPSLDPSVLRACRRDDDPDMVARAIWRLKNAGFHLGVQLMIGLPGQTYESSERDISALAAIAAPSRWDFRLYPCLVLKGTELAGMAARGEYQPLGLEEAVRMSGKLILAAENFGFNVIRVGLLESVTLAGAVAAGPRHPAFGELAMSEKLALSLYRKSPLGPWEADARRASWLTGHGARGMKRLAEMSGLSEEETRARVTFYGRV
jgi:histone acetyltransferase (RNA polymerase elongator complex component)